MENCTGPSVPRDSKYRSGPTVKGGKTLKGHVAGQTNSFVAKHNKQVARVKPS